jgi:hypothetical protein
MATEMYENEFPEVTFPTRSDDTPAPGCVTWYEHIWPQTPGHEVKIAGEDLPHAIPGDTRVPPCTVRYIIPPSIYSSNDEATEQIRDELFEYLISIDLDIASDAQISFPKLQTKRGTQAISFMEIQVTTPQLFNKLSFLPIILRNSYLIIKGKGAPVPANVITIAISRLPSPTDLRSMGKGFANVLTKHNPDEIEVWDIYAKHKKYIALPHLSKSCGTIFAAVRFKNASSRFYPTEIVRHTLPGWVKVNGQVFSLEYVGRIAHCFRCKDRASTPHEESECSYLKCWHCGNKGHARKTCPLLAGGEADDNMFQHTENAGTGDTPIPTGTPPPTVPVIPSSTGTLSDDEMLDFDESDIYGEQPEIPPPPPPPPPPTSPPNPNKPLTPNGNRKRLRTGFYES